MLPGSGLLPYSDEDMLCLPKVSKELMVEKHQGERRLITITAYIYVSALGNTLLAVILLACDML